MTTSTDHASVVQEARKPPVSDTMTGIPVDRDTGGPTTTRLMLPEACAWISVAVAFLFVDSVLQDGDDQWLVLGLGILSWLLGVRIFVGHGGPLLTAPGIYGFAFSVFFGAGGVYHAVMNTFVVRPSLVLALFLAFVAQVIIFFLFWSRRVSADVPPPVSFLSRRTSHIAASTGLSIFAVALFIRINETLSPQIEVIVKGAALAAVVLVAGALLFTVNARIISTRTVALCGMFLLFSKYVHVGPGRLHIATLGFALVAIYALRFRTMVLKYGLVLGSAPALFWLAENRLRFIETIPGRTAASRTGLESAVRPPTGFAELLDSYRTLGFDLGLGKSFLTIPAKLVPDSIWPNKPHAFGYELARITAPELFGTGFSDASSAYGEWFFNFGYLGLILMIPVVGITMPWADRLMNVLLRTPASELTRLLTVSIMIVVCAGVSDILWSGTHTYGIRTLTRLPMLLLLLLMATAPHWLRLLRAKRSPSINALRGPLSCPPDRLTAP